MTTQETKTATQPFTVAELAELVVPYLARSIRERGTPNTLHFDEVDLADELVKYIALEPVPDEGEVEYAEAWAAVVWAAVWRFDPSPDGDGAWLVGECRATYRLAWGELEHEPDEARPAPAARLLAKEDPSESERFELDELDPLGEILHALVDELAVELETCGADTRRASVTLATRLVLERLYRKLDGLDPGIEAPDAVQVFELLEAPEHLDGVGEIGDEYLKLGVLLGAPVVAWCIGEDTDCTYSYAVHPRPELVEALLGECVRSYQEAQREGILEYMRDELSLLRGAEEVG